jgi:hypothetical protein
MGVFSGIVDIATIIFEGEHPGLLIAFLECHGSC